MGPDHVKGMVNPGERGTEVQAEEGNVVGNMQFTACVFVYPWLDDLEVDKRQVFITDRLAGDEASTGRGRTFTRHQHLHTGEETPGRCGVAQRVSAVREAAPGRGSIAYTPGVLLGRS
jgi:hypothetical protein